MTWQSFLRVNEPRKWEEKTKTGSKIKSKENMILKQKVKAIQVSSRSQKQRKFRVDEYKTLNILLALPDFTTDRGDAE